MLPFKGESLKTHGKTWLTMTNISFKTSLKVICLFQTVLGDLDTVLDQHILKCRIQIIFLLAPDAACQPEGQAKWDQ